MIYVTSRSVVILIFLVYLHLINEAIEPDICQEIYKAIGNHLVNWNIGKLNSSCSYLITNVVVLDINMFCPGIQNMIVCKCN